MPSNKVTVSEWKKGGSGKRGECQQVTDCAETVVVQLVGKNNSVCDEARVVCWSSAQWSKNNGSSVVNWEHFGAVLAEGKLDDTSNSSLMERFNL